MSITSKAPMFALQIYSMFRLWHVAFFREQKIWSHIQQICGLSFVNGKMCNVNINANILLNNSV